MEERDSFVDLIVRLAAVTVLDMEKSMWYWVGYIWENYWPRFIDGTIMTIEIAVLGTLLGFVLGFIIGAIQSTPKSANDSIIINVLKKIMKFICTAFVEIFRGTPMMVQAMVIYYGLKSTGINMAPFTAAVLVTLLNTGAYMAETVRAGILSIEKGQTEGAISLGMSHIQSMSHVILPQAFKNIVPEMVNLFLTNLKMTSVLNVIGISELFFVTKTAANTYYKYFESFLITGLIYFVLCFFFSRVLSFLEKKLSGKSDYELAKEYIDEE